ncbi:MAG TPA: efflux RND transporter permease subunit, partial [Gammaproteobacteria bacterium]|nr:efflux RND transporter permease subunit [Gammaproteobacteria bacterium]
MKKRFRSGGLAAWSIHHPVGISMLTLSVLILGLFSFKQLGINLLPHIIAPEVLVRILDPGVPASIMEDRVTRQLEEQLAITEDAIAIESRTTEGRSAVDLSFPYGTDINNALRDASIRLDRAKRFLPPSNEPPVIYKHDPSQIPVMELVVSSDTRSSVELRSWADYIFSKWFLNLPGVASVEVGGGLEREIHIIPDQEKLAASGLSLQNLATQIQRQNTDAPGGRMSGHGHEVTTRAEGRFRSLRDIEQLPLQTEQSRNYDELYDFLQLDDIAMVRDSHKDERLRIRLNKVPGIKLSIQKQPQANTVAVVDEVKHRLKNLQKQHVIPEDIQLAIVADQSVFVRHAITNAARAAASGALLAMIVIYLFLGSLQRTLIIGTAIPVGILVTFIIMQAMGLTLNIMTLGGLALGMGLLIDSTIVMLENITRHQAEGEVSEEDAIEAATEVNSPIVASTSTNLGALLPFLFIGGMSGMLFQELIITITSAMLAALVVALTLVPALGARVKYRAKDTGTINKLINIIKVKYNSLSSLFIPHPLATLLVFVTLLLLALLQIRETRQIDLPRVDAGRVTLSITGDPSMRLDDMDNALNQLENLLLQDKNVDTLFTTSGGFVFGRSVFGNSNRSSISIQLVPINQRTVSSQQWVEKTRKIINDLRLTGFKLYLRVAGVPGMHLARGSDDVSIYIRGENLEKLRELGEEAVKLLEGIDGLSNLTHSYEEVRPELSIQIDRLRAAQFNVDASDIGTALKIALDGEIISTYIEGGKDFDIRLRLPLSETWNPNVLENLLIDYRNGQTIRLGDIASINYKSTASRIVRSQQQRIVEISASYNKGVDRSKVLAAAMEKLADLKLPQGYVLYDNDSNLTLEESQHDGLIVLFLAIFLVFVVMAVQYESLLNPLIIMLSIPFSAIGIALGLLLNPDMTLSMPVWLGFIMLTGI